MQNETDGSGCPVPQAKALSESQKKELSTVKAAEVKLRDWLKIRKVLTKEEQGALELKSYHELAQYWIKVSAKEKSDLDQRRQSGWAKWGHNYQSFGVAVIGFMKDWEPIINIVKGFGGAYGDMAIGTISLVFVIAKNKNMAEDYLSSALVNIKDRMIGFALYESIYTEKNLLEDDLRSKIVDAYSGFIKLSIEATKYYKGGGTWRWLRTIGEPTKFKGMAEDVQNSIVAIRLRCEDLLSRNIDEIKKDNKKLRVQVAELLQSVDNKNLARINQLWMDGKHPMEQNEDLSVHRKLLKDELHESFDQFRPEDKKRQKFETSIEYKQWQKPKIPNLLVLVGYSEQSIAVEQYRCWLSPIVLDHIEERRANGEIHAYYLLEVRRETPLHSVMASLLFQLLSFKKDTLRKQINSLSCKDVKQIDALEDASLHVIKFFKPSDTVYILLDRVDKCREEERILLLDMLGRMVTEAPCTLKVLIVISGSDWIFNLKEIDKKHRHVFVIYEERQERMDELDY